MTGSEVLVDLSVIRFLRVGRGLALDKSAGESNEPQTIRKYTCVSARQRGENASLPSPPIHSAIHSLIINKYLLKCKDNNTFKWY